MTNEEVRESVGLFKDQDHWIGFIELAAQVNNLRAEFFAPATKEIRAHFRENLPAGWKCEGWNEHREDSRWYHEDFGSSSLVLCFGWKYEFVLKLWDEKTFDSAGMSEALATPEFKPVRQAMEREDPHPHSSCKLFERNNFHFGSQNDGMIPGDEMAWYAYHRKDDFVKQAIKKVERFLGDPEVVRLLEKLNRDFKRP